MPLTDAEIRLAKPKDKPYKLADGGGLVLLINLNGSKWWRLRYRMHGRDQMLSLGVYSDVPLRLAGDRREEARRTLAAGGDPSAR